MSEEFEEEDYRLPDSTKYSAIGTLVGMVAVFFMVILGMIYPEGVSGMDQTKPINEFIELSGLYTTEITLVIVLDTIFITGYISLFIGLWLLIRDFSEIMSKLGLGTGVLVGLFDLIENSLIIVVVNGLQTGWTPEVELYAMIFILNIFIDLLSYTVGLIFGIIFLTIFKPWDRKFFLGILLIAYVIIGLGSIIIPELILVRSLMFVLGLIVGGIVLFQEEDIPLDVLQQLVDKQKENKGDFV